MRLIDLNQEWLVQELLDFVAENLCLKLGQEGWLVWLTLMMYLLQVQRYLQLEAAIYHQVLAQKQEEHYYRSLMKMMWSESRLQRWQPMIAKFQYYWLMIVNLWLILNQSALLMEWELVQMQVKVLVWVWWGLKQKLMEGQKLLKRKYSEALLMALNQSVPVFELFLEQVSQVEWDFEESVYCLNQIVSYQPFQHQMTQWLLFQQDQLFGLRQNLKKSILQYLMWLFSNQLMVQFELEKLQVEAFVIGFVLRKLDSSFLHHFLMWQWEKMKMQGCSMLIDSVLITHR